MGGIENSRYLMWLKSKYGNSFLSDVSPIGSYWMEHPHFTLGQAIVDKRKVSKRFYSVSAQAQFATIRGTVYEKETGEPSPTP